LDLGAQNRIHFKEGIEGVLKKFVPTK